MRYVCLRVDQDEVVEFLHFGHLLAGLHSKQGLFIEHLRLLFSLVFSVLMRFGE